MSSLQAFFAGELKYVTERTYNRKYPSLTARTAFPVASNFAPWASDVAFRSYENVGAAKIMSDAAIDFPRVDVKGEETSYSVKTLGASFDYSDLELMRAQATNMRLDDLRAMAARESIERGIDSIAFDGDAKARLPGLFSNSDIGSADATNGNWPDAGTSNAEIIADLQNWFAAYVAQNAGRERATSIGLAPNAFAKVATTPFNDFSSTTILQALQQGFLPGITDVFECPECAGVAGMSSNDVGVMYSKDPMCLELKIPAEVKVFPAQARGAGYHVPMYARISGLHIFYPKSVYVLKKLQASA